MTAESLDLGNGHTLRFMRWAPDRDLNPQYDGIPDVERYAATITHVVASGPGAGNECEGAVTFAGPVQQQIQPGHTTWDVESWEPLTISPSVLCPTCGDHGFIRTGRWVPA